MFRNTIRRLTSGNLGHRLLSTLEWSTKLGQPYKNDITRKSQIESEVHRYAKSKGLEARGAVHGEILYVIFYMEWLPASTHNDLSNVYML